MQIGGKEFDLKKKAYIMGILNVTPDSFSDGGKWIGKDAVLRRVENMIKDGASIIDIGGESTRPGFEQISCEEEIERVIPYITAIKEAFDIPVSIDTYKSAVAEAALTAGADMVNDIYGLKLESSMAQLAAQYDVPYCIMHNRDNEKHPYGNIMDDVLADLEESINIALQNGMKREKLIVDPGIGFGKSYHDNLVVMRELARLKELKCPVLLGTSRKSVIGLTLDLPVEERLEGTIATTVYGVMKGCSIIRVHDVKENYRALMMTEAMINA